MLILWQFDWIGWKAQLKKNIWWQCLDACLTCYFITLNSSNAFHVELIFRPYKRGKCPVDNWLKILLVLLPATSSKAEMQRGFYVANSVTVEVELRVCWQTWRLSQLWNKLSLTSSVNIPNMLFPVPNNSNIMRVNCKPFTIMNRLFETFSYII